MAASSSSTVAWVGVDALQLGHLERQRLDLLVAQVLEHLGGALGAERDEQHGGLLAPLDLELALGRRGRPSGGLGCGRLGGSLFEFGGHRVSG